MSVKREGMDQTWPVMQRWIIERNDVADHDWCDPATFSSAVFSNRDTAVTAWARAKGLIRSRLLGRPCTPHSWAAAPLM